MLGCFQRVHKCLRSRCRFVLKEISQTMVTTILKPHFPKFLPISWPWIEGHWAIFVHVTDVTLAVQEPAELVDVWTPGTMPAAPAKPRPARLENASPFFAGKPWFDGNVHVWPWRIWGHAMIRFMCRLGMAMDGIEIILRRGVSCKSRMLASNPVAAAQMYEGPFAQMDRRLRWRFLGCWASRYPLYGSIWLKHGWQIPALNGGLQLRNPQT